MLSLYCFQRYPSCIQVYFCSHQNEIMLVKLTNWVKLSNPTMLSVFKDIRAAFRRILLTPRWNYVGEIDQLGKTVQSKYVKNLFVFLISVNKVDKFSLVSKKLELHNNYNGNGGKFVK